MNEINSLNLRYFRVTEDDRQEMFMTYVTEIIKKDIDQIVQIGEYCLAVEYNADKTSKKGQCMIRTIGMTIGEKISKEI